jgi:hypothetical protein
VILLNRSAALLNLDRNFEAFESAKLALESGSPEVNREKAFYRLAASAYCLRDWRSSLRYYSVLSKSVPTSSDYKAGLVRAQTRVTEAETGKFNMRVL